MKNMIKKCVACMLAALMIVVTVGAYLPEGTTDVKAAGSSNGPTYMAKIVGPNYVFENGNKAGYDGLRIGQTVTVEPGATYTLSYSYYGILDGKGNLQGWLEDDTKSEVKQGADVFKTVTTKTLEMTVSDTDSSLEARFECNGSGAFYLWGISLTKNGGDGTNLLVNADFSQGNGSFIGWTFGSSYEANITTEEISSTAEDATRRNIILYNEALFADVENREELEIEESTESLAYMAKIVGPNYVFENGNKAGYDGLRIGQTVTVEPGATYTLSYSYYGILDGKGNMQGWLEDDTKSEVKQGADVFKTVTTKTLEMTVSDTDSSLEVRFECNGSGAFYLWGISLTKNGGDGTNLLVNADFSEGNGSWMGWTFGSSYVADITTEELSNTAEAATRRSIILYNEALFADVDNREQLETSGTETPDDETPDEEKPEGIPTGDPDYMAKLNGTYKEQTWTWVYQGIKPVVEKTYRFTCNYYVAEGIGGSAVMWSNTQYDAVKGKLKADTEGTIDITYTAQKNDTDIMVRFECEPNTVCYVWNVCLREEGGSVNLLNNGSFSKENGTWIGWTVKGGSPIADKAASDAAVEAYGQEIIAFDKTLLPSGQVEPPEILEGIPSGDPAYMAKIQLSAEETNWLWVHHGIKPEVGKTYQFTCNYYVAEGSGGNAVMWSTTQYDAISARLSEDAMGTVDLTYTATTGDADVMVRFECKPGSVIYVWNVCVREVDGEVNLLKNGSFSKEEGSLIDWKVKTNSAISDKAASDAVREYAEIITFDKTLLPSVEEEVLEGIPSGDPAYMAKIQLSAEETNWLWVHHGIKPEVGKTYRFTCNYYVAEGSGGNAVMWSTTKYDAVSAKLKEDTAGTVDIQYTAVAGDTDVMIRFECIPGSVLYIWNVCVSEENGEVNLLKNGSFSKEDGSFINWKVKTNSVIKDKAQSDAAKANGAEVLPFNADILPKPEVPEGIPSGNPKYMAKIQQKADAKNWLWIYQGIQTEQGKTYKFTCNYYVAEGESGNAVVWSSNDGKNTKEESAKLTSEMQGTVEIIYKLPKGDDRLNVRFETAPDTVCYVWNVCLSEVGGKVNLLKNGSFSKENGSWIGWQIGQSGVIKKKEASIAASKQYGPQIIAFDEDILPGEPIPDKVPTGDPKYMAHLVGTHMDKDGKMNTYVNVRQGITPEPGKTYIFSCNYYDRASNAGASILLWSDTSKGSEGDAYGRFRARTQSGVEGKLELKYTATEGDTFIAVSMECDPDSECYMWNFCLREEGSDINLLKNGRFEADNGTWIGWSVGSMNVKTKADSDKLTELYGYKIVAFNRSTIEAMKEEDAALKTYQDPNRAFSFDDVNKYKELDGSTVKTAVQKDTAGGDSDVDTQVAGMKGIWIATVAVAAVGLGAVGTILFKKKKKAKKM